MAMLMLAPRARQVGDRLGGGGVDEAEAERAAHEEAEEVVLLGQRLTRGHGHLMSDEEHSISDHDS